jgi:hypothetical protein
VKVIPPLRLSLRTDTTTTGSRGAIETSMVKSSAGWLESRDFEKRSRIHDHLYELGQEWTADGGVHGLYESSDNDAGNRVRRRDADGDDNERRGKRVDYVRADLRHRRHNILQGTGRTVERIEDDHNRNREDMSRQELRIADDGASGCPDAKRDRQADVPTATTGSRASRVVSQLCRARRGLRRTSALMLAPALLPAQLKLLIARMQSA